MEKSESKKSAAIIAALKKVVKSLEKENFFDRENKSPFSSAQKTIVSSGQTRNSKSEECNKSQLLVTDVFFKKKNKKSIKKNKRK